MKRSLICFEEFYEIYHKRSNYINFFKNRDQIELKKLEDQLNIFKPKHESKE